jgi:hypothetical protein
MAPVAAADASLLPAAAAAVAAAVPGTAASAVSFFESHVDHLWQAGSRRQRDAIAGTLRADLDLVRGRGQAVRVCPTLLGGCPSDRTSAFDGVACTEFEDRCKVQFERAFRLVRAWRSEPRTRSRPWR